LRETWTIWIPALLAINETYETLKKMVEETKNVTGTVEVFCSIIRGLTNLAPDSSFPHSTINLTILETMIFFLKVKRYMTLQRFQNMKHFDLKHKLQLFPSPFESLFSYFESSVKNTACVVYKWRRR